MFLDYCHLTAEGINLAMAAVASKVLASLTGKTIPPQNLAKQILFPVAEGRRKSLLFGCGTQRTLLPEL